MRIWLVQTGEPLPIDGKNPRLFRVGILAEILADCGHDVIWWADRFDHFNKRQRPQIGTVETDAGYRLELLEGPAYRKNVSFKRLLNHEMVRREFLREAPEKEPPEVIFAGYPTMALARACVEYGLHHEVPVVIDIRDLWPDTFVYLLPDRLQPLGRSLLTPMYWRAKRTFREATTIGGLSDQLVEWALEFTNRSRDPLDKAFPMAYQRRSPSKEHIEEARNFWSSRGVSQSSDEFVVCFFGTMGSHKGLDIDTVIETAAQFDKGDVDIRFVMCGKGGELNRFRRLTQGNSHILFPGWVDHPKIWELMRRSDAGLVPYSNSPIYEKNISNKPIEYLSGGLPLVSSLPGNLENLIQETDCGVMYEAGSANSLARQIQRLTNNPDKVEKLGANASTVFDNRFVAEEVYTDLADHIIKIAHHR